MKRTWKALVLAALVCLLLTATALAADEDFTYSLDDVGNATITGYTGSDPVLEIPDTLDGHTVTKIGRYAFGYSYEKNEVLEGITIPDTVTEIEYRAFSNCTALASVTLSANLTTLGSECFSNCTSLTSIRIPKSLTTVAHNWDSSVFFELHRFDYCRAGRWYDPYAGLSFLWMQQP